MPAASATIPTTLLTIPTRPGVILRQQSLYRATCIATFRHGAGPVAVEIRRNAHFKARIRIETLVSVRICELVQAPRLPIEHRT